MTVRCANDLILQQQHCFSRPCATFKQLGPHEISPESHAFSLHCIAIINGATARLRCDDRLRLSVCRCRCRLKCFVLCHYNLHIGKGKIIMAYFFIIGFVRVVSKVFFFSCSGIENKDEVYASSQLLDQKISRPVSVTCSVISRLPTDVKTESVLDVPSPAPPNIPLRPQATTAKIFGPRTEDMNKGFLMFSDEEPGLTSKLLSILLLICSLT